MKQTINVYDMREAFRRYDRYNNFTYEGYQVLFDALEEYEESTGEEIELDVIALCCEYDEDEWQDIADNYSIDLSDCEDDEERLQAVLDYLNENTWVLGSTDSTIVYQQF